jgi:hypothetical protein
MIVVLTSNKYFNFTIILRAAYISIFLFFLASILTKSNFLIH